MHASNDAPSGTIPEDFTHVKVVAHRRANRGRKHLGKAAALVSRMNGRPAGAAGNFACSTYPAHRGTNNIESGYASGRESCILRHNGD